jgi:hypothetical protein
VKGLCDTLKAVAALLCSLAVIYCYAGSTNWIAQRPALTSDYGNYWQNDQIPADLLPGLVAWLPFPAPYVGTQYCFAVNCSNDFLITGAAWTNISNGGMYFDGNDDRLIRPMNASLQITNQAAFVVWVRPAGYGGGNFGRIISSYTGGVTDDRGYMLLGISNVPPNTNCFRFQLGVGAETATHSANNTLNLNSNTCVGINYSAGDVTIYINGILSGSGSGTPVLATTNQLSIGANIGDTTRTFHGTIYELLKWNRVIASNEHFQIFNAAKSRYGFSP